MIFSVNASFVAVGRKVRDSSDDVIQHNKQRIPREHKEKQRRPVIKNVDHARQQ